jgi:hypothetical protein
MLKLEILPAGHGDSIWIEYGNPDSPRRILVDGGVTGTYKRALRPKLAALDKKDREFELLVVTHIDGDHISGILELLEDKEIGFRAKDIWFNGYRHLPNEAPDTLGPIQGERLTDFLVKPNVCWNGAFDKGAAVVREDRDPPGLRLDGDLLLTLLSPTLRGLAELKPKWEDEVVKAGLDPNTPRPEEVESSHGFDLLDGSLPDVEELSRQPFSEDDSEANGSSIALMLESEGNRILLAGDAHPSTLTGGIDRIRRGGKVSLAACKLPHHGSKANVNRQLLERLDCKTYLFSTNGAYFKHPDREAVARVIKWGGANPRLAFNYRTKFNLVWETQALTQECSYTVSFPVAGYEGTVLQF